MVKTILKILVWIVGILVGLFLLVWILIQLPSVQNTIVDKVTQSLSKTLDTKVSIDRVSIKFFKTVSVKGIYVEDQAQDTLVYAKELDVNIGLFNLLNSEIHINSISLQGAKVNLLRPERDSTFNYQFILDAFASAPADTTTTTSAAWSFGIDNVSLQETYFRMLDEYGGTDLDVAIQDFSTNIGSLDLDSMSVDINRIELNDSKVAYRILHAPQLDTLLIDTTSAGTITFPYTGWDINIDKIRLANNTIIFDDATSQPLANGFDAAHLEVQNLEININDVEWQKDRIAANIKNVAFKDRSGFELSEFSTDIEVTERQIQIQDFVVKTPETTIRNTTTLRYNSFTDLVGLADHTKVKIVFDNSEIAFQDLAYFAPVITEIKQLNTELNRTIKMSGIVEGTFANIDNILISLAVGEGTKLRAEGTAKNVTNPEKLAFNITLHELSTSYNSLKQLTNGVDIPPGLAQLGNFNLSGQFQGSLKTVNGTNVRLTTQSYTGLIGNIKLQNLTQPDDLRFQLNVQELRTQASDLEGFVEGGLPPQVANLGRIRYSGEASGTVQEFALDGTLTTDVGAAVMDLFIDFNENYTNAGYKGDLNLQNFDLGKILADTTLGSVTLAITGSGEGLALEDLQAKLEAVVVEAGFQGYTYKDVHIDGTVNKKQFVGNARIEDPNLNFTFQGNVNLNDSIPDFQFTATIDTVNLQQLNFSPTFLGFSGDIVADLSGSGIDDLDGIARIQNLAVSNDTASFYTDSIIIEAYAAADTGRVVALRSDFLKASIRGNYNIAELPKLVQNFINDYFPIDQIMSPVDTPPDLAIEPQQPAPPTDQNFEFDLQLKNPIPLLSLFVPGLNRLDTAYIVGRLDSKGRILALQSGIPNLNYQNIIVGNILFEAEGTPEAMNSTLRLEEVNFSDSLKFALISGRFRLGDDSLSLNIAADKAVPGSDTTHRLIGLGGRATRVGENYRFAFARNFILNGNTWRIPADNEILYRTGFLDINNLVLQYQQEELAINSTDEATDRDFMPIQISFKSFELSEIFQLIGFSEDTYKGNINGSVTLRQIQTNLNYLVDLDIKDILLYNEEVGDLAIKAEQANLQSAILIDVSLRGPQNDVSINGSYALTDNTFNLDANLKRLELRIADPFSMGMLENSEGTLSGNFKITGSTTAPSVDGTLLLNGISTTIGLTQVRYSFPEQEEIRITNQIVDLGEMRIEDDTSNVAILSGVVRHQNFTNIVLDLNFSTDRFMVLHSPPSGEELYYGTLVVSANVGIRGPTTLPRINIRAKTLSPTNLAVQPLTPQQAAAKGEDYIIFANPATYIEDTTRTLDDLYQLNQAGIDLSLNLEVTPDAELQIVIDPTSGDKLVAHGAANLTVTMSPSGALSITGNYEITEGQYSFNYQGLIKRDFAIRSGSRMEFIGDPLKTRFNVTATYTTRTPTYELIRNQVTALTPQQTEQSKNRSAVTVLLNMRGDLDQPQISFDIDVPDDEGTVVTSVIQQALSRLRDNPSELNKQVFGLLLFNSFISEERGGGSLADAGSSLYLSSVSNLVTSQLNRLADKYVKGVDINIGVESYQSEYALENSGNTITELQLGISKQLFSDRLTVQVGGNVNVNSENALLVEGANFSSIAGDFVLEYQLTESGNYRLRVFRRENYDALNQANIAKTGVGFFFTKSFKRKKDRRREQQPELPQTPRDTNAVRSGEQSPDIIKD